MYIVGNKFIANLATALGLMAAASLAMGIFSTSAAAASLDTLYETLMTIRGCEIVVSEGDWENLTVEIEQTVSGTGASSDAVNGIFDNIKSQMSVDLEAYCADHGDDVVEVLDDLS